VTDKADTSKKSGSGRAAALLGDWRAAERDRAAAVSAAEVALRALAAAQAAEEAASQSDESARAAESAVRLAMQAAENARKAALAAKDLATILSGTAEGDKLRANHAVEVADEALQQAADVFHEDQVRRREKDD